MLTDRFFNQTEDRVASQGLPFRRFGIEWIDMGELDTSSLHKSEWGLAPCLEHLVGARLNGDHAQGSTSDLHDDGESSEPEEFSLDHIIWSGDAIFVFRYCYLNENVNSDKI